MQPTKLDWNQYNGKHGFLPMILLCDGPLLLQTKENTVMTTKTFSENKTIFVLWHCVVKSNKGLFFFWDGGIRPKMSNPKSYFCCILLWDKFGRNIPCQISLSVTLVVIAWKELWQKVNTRTKLWSWFPTSLLYGCVELAWYHFGCVKFSVFSYNW